MKILIIGNGFDLSLGLETSYKHFIESNQFKILVTKQNSIALYFNKKNKINNWVDIERELTNFSNSVKSDTQDIKKEFNDMKIALMNYLEEAQSKDLEQNSQAFKMLKKEINSVDIILNFNYTNSIFKIANILNIDNITDKHKYVHGSIKDQDIIFGVEDNAIVPNHLFFKKSYNKNHDKYDIKNIIEYDTKNDRNNDIMVFGHSMGITDSTYFKDYISLRTTCSTGKFSFYYYGDDGWHEMFAILDNYTNNEMTKFKSNNFFPIDSSK